MLTVRRPLQSVRRTVRLSLQPVWWTVRLSLQSVRRTVRISGILERTQAHQPPHQAYAAVREVLQYVKRALCNKPDSLSVRVGSLRGRHVTCRLRARQAARTGTSPAARDRRAESGPTSAESGPTNSPPQLTLTLPNCVAVILL